MRNQEKTGKAGSGQAARKTDVDRYPDWADALRRIVAEADLPEGPIERLEVTTLANGDITCRIWPARAEEPEGIVLYGE
jgi:hypothetical protein